jgi:S-adenosylmethionine-diacylglycerol 3-amino-3-carboxypropyl transferase
MTSGNSQFFRHESRLMFGQVREDAAVELSLAGKLSKPKRILIIASGGCTAFALLGQGDYEVYALDISQAQIALVELKAAAFRSLGFAATRYMFQFDARPQYSSVRSELSADSQSLMDLHLSEMTAGLNNSGSVDQKLKTMAQLFFLSVHTRAETEHFLRMSDIDRQKAFFQQNWCNWQWKLAIKIAFNKKFLSLAQFKSAMELVPSDFHAVMNRRFERSFTSFSNATNPYLWQTFLGQYPQSEDGFPLYLQSQHESALLSNLGRLRLICDDVLSWLNDQPSASIDFFGLSNILELLPSEYAAELVPELIRCASPGAIVIARSIFPRTRPFLSDPSDTLTFDPQLSSECEQMDRSLFCNFMQVYRVRP